MVREELVETDLDRLQGRWVQRSFEEDGEADRPDTHGAQGAVMTVSGCTFHVALPEGATLLEGSFRLDEARYPKCIDWVDAIGDDAGQTIPAIYELDGDFFRFAAADPNMERPEGFAGGQGISIRSFSRA
ncbi:hypothetical protein BMG00_13625 [Thioclava marina]|uniref:TIGR03067 domain-containing protein n=1 Tax=Thioclava marina TaxID=1915077 RepID=A0ABX3MQD3_9RHOB|nr:hypothetical protein BMG00_13625 [Thioclava marina]